MSDKEFLIQLGQRIKAIRKGRKMTLRTVEKYKITDIAQLSRIENGHVNPHVLTLKKLADLYQVDITEFFLPLLNGKENT